MSGQPPEQWISWAARGLGGTLGIAEQGVRAGGVVSGPTREYLLAAAVRCLLLADSIPIQPDIREPADLIGAIQGVPLPWESLLRFCGEPDGGSGWRTLRADGGRDDDDDDEPGTSRDAP